MGFFDKLAKGLNDAGLISKGFQGQTDDWLKTVSMAEIEKMESQGLDVAEWKAKVAARDAALAQNKASRFGTAEADKSQLTNPVNLDKLLAHQKTPRDADSDFVKAVAGKLPFIGKDKHLKKVVDGLLLYAAVVQANSDLWSPGDNEYYPAVLVFALDEAHRRNVVWLKEIAGIIAELKESADVPQDCRPLVASLRDEQSDFCWKLGASINGGADAWCAVYKFEEQAALPKKCLPSEGILPFVLKDGPTENLGVWFFDIPARFYTD